MTHAHFACGDYFFKPVTCHTSLGVVCKNLKILSSEYNFVFTTL